MAVKSRTWPSRRVIGSRWAVIMTPSPYSAAKRMLSGVRAAIQVGGHGFWWHGGTRVTGSNSKYLPRYE
jgi:hypothetical protein